MATDLGPDKVPAEFRHPHPLDVYRYPAGGGAYPPGFRAGW
jgi:hypothetical protein